MMKEKELIIIKGHAYFIFFSNIIITIIRIRNDDEYNLTGDVKNVKLKNEKLRNEKQRQ